MRTTLNVDDDILHVAQQLALQRGTTAGQVLSELARKALEPGKPAKLRNGVPVFTPIRGAKKPHLALVNRLRDES
ncbi:MAG: CopG family transcriptional regulator [Bryobacteraceae bacterium]